MISSDNEQRKAPSPIDYCDGIMVRSIDSYGCKSTRISILFKPFNDSYQVDFLEPITRQDTVNMLITLAKLVNDGQ